MKNVRRQLQPVLIICIILFLSVAAAAQEAAVVPGDRVGPVRLGDSRAVTTKAMGKPSATKRWRPGLVKDSWLGPEPPPNSEESPIFFNVIYRANRVIQIEFNDPKYKTAAGLSIESTLAEFRAKHQRVRKAAYVYDDGEGSGFVGYYYDDERQGIAFSFSTQDYFDATMIPEALRVHAAGQAVVPDAGGKRTKANGERPIERPKTRT